MWPDTHALEACEGREQQVEQRQDIAHRNRGSKGLSGATGSLADQQGCVRQRLELGAPQFLCGV